MLTNHFIFLFFYSQNKMIIGFTGEQCVGKSTAGCVFDSLESTSLVYKFSFGTWSDAANIMFNDKSPRRKYPGYFVDRMNTNFKMVKEGDVVLVCDVMSDDEATCIKNNGGIIIGITRNNSNPPITPTLVDFTIENNETIDDLHSKILDLFS
jgi:hypothetical protein